MDETTQISEETFNVLERRLKTMPKNNLFPISTHKMPNNNKFRDIATFIFWFIFLFFFAFSLVAMGFQWGSESATIICPNKQAVQEETSAESITGQASFYDYTLSSGWNSKGKFVCASRDFERYSFIKVTNSSNGKSVVCKVTDYGPDASIFPERIVDLSSASFAAIADLSAGVINVKIELATGDN